MITYAEIMEILKTFRRPASGASIGVGSIADIASSYQEAHPDSKLDRSAIAHLAARHLKAAECNGSVAVTCSGSRRSGSLYIWLGP